MAPTGSVSAAGVNPSNIVEGSRKRSRLDQVTDAKAASASPRLSSAAPPNGSEANDPEEVTKIGYKLLNVVYHARDVAEEEDPTALLVEPFLALPDAQVYPDYYQIIKRPLTFEDIRLRLDHRGYTSFEEVKHDCETICNNAKRYNQRETPFWLKAKALHSVIKDAHAELTFAPSGTQSSKLDLPPTTQLLFDVHVEGVDPMTSAPPSPVKIKQQQGEEAKANGVTEDEDTSMEEMGSSSGSKAASAGHRRITIKKKAGSQTNAPTSAALAAPLPSAVGSLAASSSAAAAAPRSSAQEAGHSTDLSTAPSPVSSPALQEPSDDGPSTIQSNQQVATSPSQQYPDYMTQSPSSVKNNGADKRRRPFGRGKNLKSQMKQWVNELIELKRPDGESYASDFFEELPSPEEYPDYYKVILKPISLKEINQKVAARSFKTPYSFFSAVRTMIANAKYYNEENSVIWQDADLMEKLIDNKILPAAFELGFTLDPNDNRSSVLPVHVIEAHETSLQGSPSNSLTPPPAGQSSNGTRLKVKLGGRGSLPGQDFLPDGVGQQQPSTIEAFASPPSLPDASVVPTVHPPAAIPAINSDSRITTAEAPASQHMTASGRPVRSAASRTPATRDLPPPLTSQKSYSGPARSPPAPQIAHLPPQQLQNLSFRPSFGAQDSQQQSQRSMPLSKGSYGSQQQGHSLPQTPGRYPPSQQSHFAGGSTPYAVQQQPKISIVDTTRGGQIRRLPGVPPRSVFCSSSRPIRVERTRDSSAGSSAASSPSTSFSLPAIPSFVILAPSLRKVINVASVSGVGFESSANAGSRQFVLPVGQMREEVKVLFKLRTQSAPVAKVATDVANGEVHGSAAGEEEIMGAGGEGTSAGAGVNGDGHGQSSVNGEAATAGEPSTSPPRGQSYDPAVSAIFNGRKSAIHWSPTGTATVSVQLQRGTNLLEIFLVPGPPPPPPSSTAIEDGREQGEAGGQSQTQTQTQTQMQMPCEGYRLWIVR